MAKRQSPIDPSTRVQLSFLDQLMTKTKPASKDLSKRTVETESIKKDGAEEHGVQSSLDGPRDLF